MRSTDSKRWLYGFMMACSALRRFSAPERDLPDRAASWRFASPLQRLACRSVSGRL